MTMLFRLAVLGAVLGCNLRTSADVADAFRNPPREAALQTWWHWVGNGVTKEGITADLEAMRDVGISRAYIFVPSGPTPVRSVEMLSPEWFDLFDHALREAKRCGVELGAHNCPGWSSSGGPWIRPEDSMKMLVASETILKNGETGVFLDLGEVREIARVRLNGTDLGVWSFPPFCHDVTSALVSGENRLEVEVVNNWPNRLIGDAILRQKGIPEKDLNTWSSYPEAWAADEPLHPAGLLGPVCLRAKERVK